MKFALIVMAFSEIALLFVTIAQGLSGENILFDVSQLAKDALIPHSKQNKAYSDLNTIIKRETISILYYETDFKQSICTEVRNLLELFRNINNHRSGPKIVFSIKDVEGLNGSKNTRLFNDLLELLSDYGNVIAGLAYNAFYLDYLCSRNTESFRSSHPTTSIISNIRQHILESNSSKNVSFDMSLGYELHVNYLKCTVHQQNIQLSDFLIVDVPLPQNDTRFVESYGLFQNLLDNEIMPAVFSKSGQNKILVKLSLIKTAPREDWKAFYTINKRTGERIYDTHQEKLLDFAKDSMATYSMLTFYRYKHLITEYMHQWVLDQKQKNISVILTCSSKCSYSDSTKFVSNLLETTNIIPFVSYHSLAQINDIGAEIFLRDVVTSGFTTLMFSADVWQSFRNNTIGKRFNLYGKSLDVFYHLENEDQFDSIRHKPESVNGSNQIDVITIMISHKIDIQNKRFWEDWIRNVTKLKKKTSLACQVSTDNLKSMSILGYCENSIHCEAFNIRASTINNCKQYDEKSTTIIWLKTINFTELEQNRYRLEDFVSTVKGMLDSLLVARVMYVKDYPKVKIIINFRSFYSGNLSWNGGTTMYCNTYAERISQLYDAIITWAQIHDFPVILEPSGQMYRFDHALAWNQLEVPISNPMHDLMNTIPMFIRRNYITTKTLGWWHTGTNPCVERATPENLMEIKPNSCFNAGVTLQMNLRQTNLHLTANEFQVILLLSLHKFMEVGVHITHTDDVEVLKETVATSAFDKNLKANEIVGKAVHLQLADNVCSEFDNSILKETIMKLEKAGLRVKTSAKSFQCVKNLKSELSEIGLVVNNCLSEAQNIVQSHLSHNNTKINWTQISFIICVTDEVIAHNRVAKDMQDYLDSHLYLKKLFQYFHPNLKEIHFQLKPQLIEDVDTISDLLMFLTDVNNYAIGYGMKYFLIQAFAEENQNGMERSFWTISNYSNLTDLTVYRDQLAEYPKQLTWVPSILIENKSNTETMKTSTSATGETSYETSTKSSSRKSESMLVPQIAGGIGVTAFCIVLMVTVYLLRRKATRLTQKEIHEFRNGRQETIREAAKERQNNQYTVNIYEGLVFQKEYEIPKRDISINRKVILGKGKFTTSHISTLANFDGFIACVKVANKKCSKPAFKGLMSELKVLSYLEDHMNIVRFIGCYTKEIGRGVLWILTDYCEGGSLHAYLKTKTTADILELVRFSYGIARGMEYISNQKVIHGNLRTAVIFLDGTKTCKISGYGGLAGVMEDLRKQTKKNKAPKEWQWLAYETLKSGEFSMETDIWSFGVTIWEIFSLGDYPFANINWYKFIDFIESGNRLPLPEIVSKEIRDFIIKCWNVNPKERPNFSTLVDCCGSALGTKVK